MGRFTKTLAALAIAAMPMLYADKAAGQTAPTIDIVTPVAASVAGGNNSKWRTDVGMFNMNAAPAVVDVFYAENGLPATPSASITVPANGSLTLNDIVDTTFHKPGTAGMLAFDVRDASQAARVFATSSVYNLQSDGGTAGSTFPSIPVSKLFSPGSTSYAPTTADSLGNRDNIGVAAGPSGASVTAVLRNMFSEVRATKTIALSPFTRTQTSIAGFFGHDVSNPILSGLQGGMVELTVNNGSATWYVSENDNQSNSPTAHHGTNKTGEKIYLMGAGKVAGANNTQWTTDVKLHNTNNNAIFISMQYLPPGDNLNNSTTPVIGYQILGHQTMNITDVIKNGFGLETGNGTILITDPAKSVIVDSRTKNTTPHGTYGVGFNGQFNDEGATSTTTTVTSLVVPLTQNATTRTNLGLQNASPYNANVTIDYYNPDGSKIMSIEDTLLPFSPKQYNSPLTPSVENAYAVITSTQAPLEASRQILANTYNVNAITGQNTNNKGVAISSVKKVTGEEYVAKWLDPVMGQYFYWNNDETRCLLNDACGAVGYGDKILKLIFPYSGLSGTDADFIKAMRGLADGSPSNGELYAPRDPGVFDLRENKALVCFELESKGNRMCFTVPNELIDDVGVNLREYMVTRTNLSPASYGGTTSTGPNLSFDPTFTTQNSN